MQACLLEEASDRILNPIYWQALSVQLLKLLLPLIAGDPPTSYERSRLNSYHLPLLNQILVPKFQPLPSPIPVAIPAPSAHPYPLKGDLAGQFALKLEGAKRLVFKPGNKLIPLTEDGSIDLSRAINQDKDTVTV